jgi:hypothetical protein
MLTLSIQPDATFARGQLVGRPGHPGANDDCVGRVIVNAIASPGSRAHTMDGRVSTKSAIATAAQNSAWPA